MRLWMLYVVALAGCGRVGFDALSAAAAPDGALGAAAQVTYLKASNAEMGDNFGNSVAISGDTLAVGAWFESSATTGVDGDQTDNAASSAGAVYIFVRSAEGWTQQAYLKASNTAEYNCFGSSVSLSGNTLAVGSFGESSGGAGVGGNQPGVGGAGSGAAYVFVRTGTTWTQQAYLKASNAGVGDSFGTSVSLDGDTLVVGATQESSTATGVNGDQANNGAQGSGAAYVFVRSGAAWTQQAYLKPSNTRTNSYFGSPVSLSGDTVAIGASEESSAATGIDGDQADSSAFQAGAAYVFTRTGTKWAQQAYLKASNAGPGDQFGTSLSLWGDTLAVGAPYEASTTTGINGDQDDNNTAQAGAVYIFARSGATWRQQAYLKGPKAIESATFSQVALFGDVLAVGAPNTPPAGALYTFVRSGTAWRPQSAFTQPDLGLGDSFGNSLALSGDTLVAAAIYDSRAAIGVNGNPTNAGAHKSGAVYVFR